MYCSSCGTQQQEDTKFCANCGVKIGKTTGENQTSSPKDNQVMPEEVRKSLSKFEKHSAEVQCLECGYLGPMGLIGKFRPTSYWIFAVLAVLLGAAFLPLGGIGLFILAVGIVIIETAVTKTKVACPNCDENLIVARDAS